MPQNALIYTLECKIRYLNQYVLFSLRSISSSVKMVHNVTKSYINWPRQLYFYSCVPGNLNKTPINDDVILLLLPNAIIPSRLILVLASNLVKTCLPIAYCSVVKLFRNFPQNMTVPVHCSVQIVKTVWHQKWMFWTLEISRALSLRWVSDRYSILQQPSNPILISKH